MRGELLNATTAHAPFARRVSRRRDALARVAACDGRGARLPASGFGVIVGLLFLCRTLAGLAVLAAAALAIGSLASVANAQEPRGRIAPEGASGVTEKAGAVARNMMVSAANPHATAAGLEILRAGGSAVDAAIATQLVLNLVEPQSSGIGGGAFILHYEQTTGRVRSYDGRETAPAAAKPDRFLRDGRPMSFWTAVNSGLSVGVPGTLKVLELAHQRHGKLPWARLFEPAIRLSRGGFRVSQRLNVLLNWYGASRFSPKARAYFFDASDAPRPVGYLLKNPEFAETLSTLASQGADAFYSDGTIARSIIDAVENAPNAQGDMTLADITGYRALERPPVCVDYREKQVCGMGPPSSGGLTVAQTLKLLEGFSLGSDKRPPMSATALHLIAESEKLAYADRNRYMADTDFVPLPEGLLDDGYLSRRRSMISLNDTLRRPPPGEPTKTSAQQFGTDATRERSGTSHLSIVDGEGNAVSMTTTIEGGFGSGLWASGFLLNNELTDFSFRSRDSEGRPIANRVQGGKRPRSSMAPSIVLDGDGRFKAAVGSVGGSRIILYVAKSLVALIDWNMNAQEVAALANFGSRGSHFEVELGPQAIWLGLKVKPFGHVVIPDLMTSGTHIVLRRADGMLEGGADPRREGVAMGE